MGSDVLLKMTRQFLNLLKLLCLDFLGKFNYKNVNIPKVSIQKRKRNVVSVTVTNSSEVLPQQLR